MVALNFLSHAYGAPKWGSHYRNLLLLPYLPQITMIDTHLKWLQPHCQSMETQWWHHLCFLMHTLPIVGLEMT